MVRGGRGREGEEKRGGEKVLWAGGKGKQAEVDEGGAGPYEGVLCTLGSCGESVGAGRGSGGDEGGGEGAGEEGPWSCASVQKRAAVQCRARLIPYPLCSLLEQVVSTLQLTLARPHHLPFCSSITFRFCQTTTRPLSPHSNYSSTPPIQSSPWSAPLLLSFHPPDFPLTCPRLSTQLRATLFLPVPPTASQAERKGESGQCTMKSLLLSSSSRLFPNFAPLTLPLDAQEAKAEREQGKKSAAAAQKEAQDAEEWSKGVRRFPFCFLIVPSRVRGADSLCLTRSTNVMMSCRLKERRPRSPKLRLLKPLAVRPSSSSPSSPPPTSPPTTPPSLTHSFITQ